MVGWRASIGACVLVVASSATAAAGSPIAELEALLRREQAEKAAAARAEAVAAVANGGERLRWTHAVLRRDPRLRPAAIDPQPSTATAAEASSELSSSVGCVVGGTIGTTVASLAGGMNTINLIGGGIVSAVNPATYYVSMMGLIFVAFCQLGASVTPLYVYMTTPVPEPIIGPPVALPPPPEPAPRLDDLPDFRRGVPYQSQQGVPMIRAAEHPLPAAAGHAPCAEDRRSIRRALSTLIHGAAAVPACPAPAI